MPSSKASEPGAYQNPSRYSLPVLDKTVPAPNLFLGLLSCWATNITMPRSPRSIGGAALFSDLNLNVCANVGSAKAKGQLLVLACTVSQC